MAKITNRWNLQSTRTKWHMALQTTKEEPWPPDAMIAMQAVRLRQSFLIWKQWNGPMVLIFLLVQGESQNNSQNINSWICLRKLYLYLVKFRNIQQSTVLMQHTLSAVGKLKTLLLNLKIRVRLTPVSRRIHAQATIFEKPSVDIFVKPFLVKF